MKKGTIGSGNVGSTLGKIWSRNGHEILFSSRNPDKLKSMAESVRKKSILWSSCRCSQVRGSRGSCGSLGASGKCVVICRTYKWKDPYRLHQSTKTSVYMASSPKVKGISGRYFEACKAVPSSPMSYDRELQETLWSISEKLSGLD